MEENKIALNLLQLLYKNQLTNDSEFETFIENSSNQIKEEDPELWLRSKAIFNDIKSKFMTTISTYTKPPSHSKLPDGRKPIRLYVDGAFDITHSGHYNALRRAKQMCDVLVVGVVSDEEICKYKGPPVMNVEERACLARACKWVDEVILDVPYFPTLKDLDDFNCDFIAHGDDMITIDGVVMYKDCKDAGRLKVFKRTEGISTTDIIGRMLSLSRAHIFMKKGNDISLVKELSFKNKEDDTESRSRTGSVSTLELSKAGDFEKKSVKGEIKFKMLNSTRRIIQFSNNRVPSETDKIVYTAGSFDVLHKGHIKFLEKAKQQGTYLIVGLHDDETINACKGFNYPILTLNERVLSVLAVKYVDEVIIGSPWVTTAEIINSLGAHVVVAGKFTSQDVYAKFGDPFEYPRQAGIYKEIDSETDFKMDVMIKRIIENQKKYQEIWEIKTGKQQKFYEARMDANGGLVGLGDGSKSDSGKEIEISNPKD